LQVDTGTTALEQAIFDEVEHNMNQMSNTFDWDEELPAAELPDSTYASSDLSIGVCTEWYDGGLVSPSSVKASSKQFTPSSPSVGLMGVGSVQLGDLDEHVSDLMRADLYVYVDLSSH